jgi:hypothetical protein
VITALRYSGIGAHSPGPANSPGRIGPAAEIARRNPWTKLRLSVASVRGASAQVLPRDVSSPPLLSSWLSHRKLFACP